VSPSASFSYKRGADRMVRSYIVEGVGGNGSLGHAIDLHVGDLIEPICSYGESLAYVRAHRQSSFG
jgi:hypothetical protein